nr:hypothetical protein [Methanobrevibacter smithii]
METIKINPEECEIFGNIISNKHGYLEDKNDFESHKCMVSLNNVKPDEWESYNVYSFKLSKDVSLTNRFSEDIQYCMESSLSSLFVNILILISTHIVIFLKLFLLEMVIL